MRNTVVPFGRSADLGQRIGAPACYKFTMRILAALLLAAAVCYAEDRLADLEKATDMNDAGSVYSLAQWCKENQQNRKANAYFTKVIKLDPEHAGARLALGQIKVGTRWINQKDQKVKPISTAPEPSGTGPTFAEQVWDLSNPPDPEPDNDFALAYIAKLDHPDHESDAMEVAIGTLANAENRASAIPKLCAAMGAGAVKRIYGPCQIAVLLVRYGRRDLALQVFPFAMKASAGVANPADGNALVAMIEILRDKRGVPRLIELLGSTDTDLKEQAALTATTLTGVVGPTTASLRTWWDRCHGRSDGEIWKEQLRSDSANVALGAAVLLIDQCEPAILGTITRYLKSPNVREVRLAVEALTKLTRQDWGINPEAPLEYRTKKAAQIDTWWKEGLERFEWPESETRIRERAAQAAIVPATDPLAAAVLALGQAGAATIQAENRLIGAGPSAVPALIGGLGDANLIVRRKSADLLTRITKKTDIPFDPRGAESVRTAAIEAWTAWAISQNLLATPGEKRGGDEVKQ